MRRLILALLSLAVGSAPPASYFPSGINSLIKQVDGRTRRHTGLYTLRVLRSLATNLINIISPFFAISVPEDQAVPTTIANYVLRVPREPATHPASVIEQIFKQGAYACAKLYSDSSYPDMLSYKAHLTAGGSGRGDSQRPAAGSERIVRTGKLYPGADSSVLYTKHRAMGS